MYWVVRLGLPWYKGGITHCPGAVVQYCTTDIAIASYRPGTGTHLVHPTVRLESNVITYGEKEASIPMNEKHYQEKHLTTSLDMKIIIKQ